MFSRREDAGMLIFLIGFSTNFCCTPTLPSNSPMTQNWVKPSSYISISYNPLITLGKYRKMWENTLSCNVNKSKILDPPRYLDLPQNFMGSFTARPPNKIYWNPSSGFDRILQTDKPKNYPTNRPTDQPTKTGVKRNRYNFKTHKWRNAACCIIEN